MKAGPMHSCAKPRTTLSMLSWRKTTVFLPKLVLSFTGSWEKLEKCIAGIGAGAALDARA